MPKTLEEKRAYNREYSARPEVIAWAKVRNARPERVAKRKAYKKTDAGKAAEKRYRATEPSVKYQHEYRLKKLYGIDEVGYQSLLVEQDGQCAICLFKPEGRLHIDHDHETGQVRGLLCGGCNRALGLFKDNPELLKEAAAYLER